MAALTDYRAKGIEAEVLPAFPPLGPDISPEDLVRAFTAAWDLDDLLRTLGTLASEIADVHDRALNSVAYQLSLGKRLNCGKDLPPDLVQGFESGPLTAITSTTQIANLALFAISNRDWPGLVQRVSLLRLLGSFNYCTQRKPGANVYYVDPESIEAGFAVATSHVDRHLNVVSRYLEFFDWAQQNTAVIDVPALFIAQTGLNYEDYARCVTALDEYYNGPKSSVVGMPALEPTQITSRGEALHTWLAGRAITEVQVDSFLREDPFVTLRDKGYFQVLSTPFAQCRGRYYLLNQRALDNSLGVGAFYLPLDALTARAAPGRGRARAAQDYFAFAGQFFEPYAGQLVKRIANRSSTKWHSEVRDMKGDMSSDFFVIEDDKAVFFEMRFGRVAKPVIESLAPQKIEDTFENILYSKIEQLDRNIRRFASGDLSIPGTASNSIRRIYPVVCLPSPFPRSPAIQLKIDKDLGERGWLKQPAGAAFEVAPFEVIEAESLEGLDGLQEPFRFSDLIDEKIASDSSRFTFFKNYLTTVKGLKLQMDRERQDEIMALLRTMEAQTRDWIA